MAKSGIKASANLQARIKRMMQSDEDVGKVAKASPVLIGARHALSSIRCPCRPAILAGRALWLGWGPRSSAAFGRSFSPGRVGQLWGPDA